VFKKLKSLRIKLPAMMVGLSAAMIMFVAAAAYLSVADKLAETVQKTVETAAASEVITVSHGLEGLRAQLSSQANNAFAATGIEELTKWVEIGEADRTSITEFYRKSKASTEERVKLTGVGHRHGFSWRHLPVHQSYMPMQQLFGYQDVILLSEAGRVIYTINKGNEFIEKMDSPAWADTSLGRIHAALKSAKPGSQSFVDFAPQNHIGQPVFENSDSTGGINAIPKRLGTLVFAIDTEFLSRSLFYNGQNGAMSMVINAGGNFVSSLKNVSPHLRIADAKSALGLNQNGAGSGYGRLAGLSGDAILVATKQMDGSDGGKWTVAHVRSEKQAFLLRDDILSNLVKFSAIAMIPGTLLAMFIGWSLVRPISGLAQAMTNIADGRLQDEVPSQGRSDEIGDIATAVHTMRTKLAAEAATREREQEEASAESATQRNLLMNDLADDLDRTIAAIATSVSASAEELNVTARELESGAMRGQDSSATVNASAQSAVSSMHSINKSAEDLRHAVDMIDREVQLSDEAAGAVRKLAEETGRIVEGLDEGARRVSDVVVLISNIAEQTNLLALNATIEAARAGEAGRGFAVVAAEVKELASQTARATQEISSQIAGMNAATQSSVEAITSIQEAIGELNAATRRSAETVAGQKQASQLIVADVARASHDIDRIGDAAVLVSAASEQTSQSAQGVLSAASELGQQSTTLKNRVEGFIAQVRSA
jgi:methyl-accepting chemotaxis protein